MEDKKGLGKTVRREWFAGKLFAKIVLRKLFAKIEAGNSRS